MENLEQGWKAGGILSLEEEEAQWQRLLGEGGWCMSGQTCLVWSLTFFDSKNMAIIFSGT